MTSPARGGPDTAGMRGEAAVARIHLAAWLKGNTSNPDGDAWRPADVFAAADELLPVVQRLAVETAAEELRAAAVCPTPCDGDCDADCHEAHTPSWKRLHQPEHCPSRLLAAAAQPTDGRTGE